MSDEAILQILRSPVEEPTPGLVEAAVPRHQRIAENVLMIFALPLLALGALAGSLWLVEVVLNVFARYGS